MTPRNSLATRSAHWIYLVQLLLSATLTAQTIGRLQIQVTDTEGQPIAGARVVLRAVDGPATTDEKVTNRRGTALFTIKDATFRFELGITADGYQPINTTVKPAPGDTTRFKYELAALSGTPAADSTSTDAPTHTPAETKHNHGVEALQRGDRGAALGLFREAIALDDALAPSHSALAGLFLELERYTDAVEAAERLLELQPDSVRAISILYDVGQKSGDEGLIKRAERLFERAGISLDNPAVKYNQATDALAVGDFQTAKRLFAEALALDPELAPAALGLTITHFNLGEHAEAAEMAERTLELDPDNLRALSVRYESYRALGDTANERTALEELAKRDPKTLARQLHEQATQLFNGGQVDEARAELEKVLEIDADFADAHFLLGLCSVNSGDNAAAREHFQRFLDLGGSGDNATTARQMLEALQ